MSFRFDENDWYSMINVYKKSRSAQTFLSNYDYEDVGVFHVTTHSASTWSISPPELESMIEQLKAPGKFVFCIVVARIIFNSHQFYVISLIRID